MKYRLLTGIYALMCITFVTFNACQQGEEQAEREALAFLYRSMPLPDSVDYSRDFWLQNVRAALQARREMPWGEKVPDREWLHFVLPVRVNNENLDTSRVVFYNELHSRVQDCSMYDAVLEVNHWCHEHVTYQPSDSRTSSPLATLRSAIGRCGEESTFTVAAIRAVGIPARQVYTPRWAHTDDNHAWVEAWVDGTWYFLGACEPEPVLNLGWFNAPASRGMLMHTRAFGAYDGPEEVVSKTRCYTEINVTANYAPVSTLVVKTVDEKGNALPARVDFRLYNYAEFYSLVNKQTNADGFTSLQCGRGDLLVWASVAGKFGYSKASVGKEDTVTVVIDKDEHYTATVDFDLMPPVERNTLPDLTEEQVRVNKERFAYEDSVRNAYMARAFYVEKGESTPCDYEKKARANWRTIADFRASDEGKTQAGQGILTTLRDKDFRDVTREVLLDHVTNTKTSDNPLWQRYILAPRVSNEMLTPYRQTLSQVFAGKGAEDIIQWVMDSVKVDETTNPQHLCMSPLGVFRHRTTDSHSRDIFFVAAARSAGLAARIDEVTGKVQWADDGGTWHDVLFAPSAEEVPHGTLQLCYAPTPLMLDPAYYSQFSLARIKEGNLQLQEYDEGATWQQTFALGAPVDAGSYLLTTGTRLADGGVLAHLQFFAVAKDSRHTESLLLRQGGERLQVIGHFNSELLFKPLDAAPRSLLSVAGRGYYVVGFLRPGHEPSTHALRDLAAVAPRLEEWGRTIFLLFASQEDYELFRPADFDGLPSNVVLGIQQDDMLDELKAQDLLRDSNMPVFLVGDTFNRVVWLRQGYTIGLGEQLLQVKSHL
ncbi:MAG: transglutaminase domain-containing protein [Bacteroidaceae bacterium]|nr:transglutaminase domain-containing protein [Bacteroidaceae bacterium]